MGFSYAYTIHGRPVAKKNRHRVRFTANGRAFVGNDDVYLRWADDAALELRCQRGNVPTIPRNVQLHADVTVFLARGQRMDSDNALGGPFDALQDAGVVANDAQIKSHTLRMDRDRANPRVEIRLTPFQLNQR
jgi:Holliday junction resolvase RusA-like endonuclease